MTLNRTMSAAALAAVLAGCAERPVAVSPPLETQPRWETVAHWRALAERAADGLVAATGRNGLEGRSFHLRVEGADTAFGQVFPAQLAAALSARGGALADVPPGAVVVNVAARPLARAPRTPRTVPGAFSVGGAGALGIRYLALHPTGWDAAAAAFGMAGLLDALAMSQPTSEVLVDIAVTEGSRPLYRLVESFYVRRENLAEYGSAAPPQAVLATGPAVLAPGSARHIAVVGDAPPRAGGGR